MGGMNQGVARDSVPSMGGNCGFKPGVEVGGGFLNPLLGGENEAVQSCLDSNPVEFDGIKTGVVKAFPDSEELDGAAAAEPVADDIVRVVGVLQFGNVSETKEVLALMRKNGNGGSLDIDAGFLGFGHRVTSGCGAEKARGNGGFQPGVEVGGGLEAVCLLLDINVFHGSAFVEFVVGIVKRGGLATAADAEDDGGGVGVFRWDADEEPILDAGFHGFAADDIRAVDAVFQTLAIQPFLQGGGENMLLAEALEVDAKVRFKCFCPVRWKSSLDSRWQPLSSIQFTEAVSISASPS
jgi:hypothetical protein